MLTPNPFSSHWVSFKLLAAGRWTICAMGVFGVAMPAQAVDTCTSTGSLVTERYGHSATLLANGKVLVAGGTKASGFLDSAELYDPGTGAWTTTNSLATVRVFHTATLLHNGKVLVIGGLGLSSSS